MTRLLWLGAVALGTLGTALVFAGVTMAGLFLPGVVLIDVGLAAAVAAALASLRAPDSTPPGVSG